MRFSPGAYPNLSMRFSGRHARQLLLQVSFYLRKLVGCETPHLPARRSPAIKDLEDRAELIQRESDCEHLPDHSHVFKRVFGILAITIARPL
jgi:hypothetical protein